MFSLIARMLRKISRYHRLVFLIAGLISILCIYPATHLRWELQLADMLESPQKQTSKNIDEASLLTIILEGKDSAENRLVATKIAKRLEEQPSIQMVSHEIDISFYEKNGLLFLPSSELNKIYERLVTAKEKAINAQNPLIVQLEEQSEKLDFKTDDFEDRYKGKLKDLFQNDDGTVRVLEVFPTTPIFSLDSARKFISLVKETIQPIVPASINVEYTGKVQKIVDTGRELLPKAKQAGWVMAGLFAILLFLSFLRHPQLILPAGMPIGLSIYWTLGIAYLLYGRMCLFSMFIVFLLPGLAAQHVTHIFRRYSEERMKGLNPALSLESALLGIGPVAAVSSAVFAIIFISLLFLPLKGAHELAVLGCIGAALNYILCSALTPAILRVLQKRKPFHILGATHAERIAIKPITPFRYTNIFSLLLVVLTFALAFQGLVPKFNYNFSETELSKNTKADSLLATTGLNFNEPVVINFPNQETLEKYIERYNTGVQKGLYNTIERIYTLNNLLPTNQRYKLQIIKNIQEELESPVFADLHGSDSIAIGFLKEHTEISEITAEQLPESSQKLLRAQQRNNIFATIIPAKSAENGLDCRRLARDIKKLDDGNNYQTFGMAMVRAEILDNILRHLHKSIIFCSIAIFIILIMLFGKIGHAFFVIIPSAISFIWLFSILSMANVQMNFYSVLALPILVGLSIDGSVHFWNHYLSKQSGSAIDILRHYGKSILISQIAALIGIFSLLFSSHPGLQSIGQISLLGLILIGLAIFFIFPLSAATLDAYRLRKSKDKF